MYENVGQADVSEYSTKEDQEDLELDWYIGDLFDSVGRDEPDGTGAEGVTDTGNE